MASVNEVTAANRYTGNGTTTAFVYGFSILADTHIEVLVDGVTKTLTTDYTVSGVGASVGGTVTFVTAPANGLAVTLLRKQPAAQLSEYEKGEGFPADRIEKDLDKLTMQVQQLKEQLQRTIAFAKQSTLSNVVFPEGTSAANRANKFVRWDATGTALEIVELP
jgi:tail fiber protein